MLSVREELPAATIEGADDVAFERVTDRHDDVTPGTLFAAVLGASLDGANFLDAAVERGAVGVLTDRPLAARVPRVRVDNVRSAYARLVHAAAGNPADRLRLVGVTGTDGKTTTVSFVTQLLRSVGRCVAFSGTVEVCDGHETAPATLTTPGPAGLARWLTAAVDAGSQDAVVEISSHALDQHRCDGLTLDAAVITNIRRDHLDYHGSADAYRAAKARIVELVRPGGLIVLGPGAEPLREVVTGDRTVVTAGQSPRYCTTRLIGRHNQQNAAAAETVAAFLTVTTEQLAAATLSGPRGRMEPVCERPTVLVDYAHTPAAIRAVVDAGMALARRQRGRLFVLSGAGGDRDAGKRPLMGRELSRADRIYLTSDNPRSESVAVICRDILSGCRPCDVRPIFDREAAIASAIGSLQPDDVLLVLGKGHETTQTDRRGVHPFDDREVCRRVLSRRAAA